MCWHKQLTCPTRQLISNAVQNGHEGRAPVIWRQVYLLYNQSAGDRDGVYPFIVRIQHLECLYVVLPKDGETLGGLFFKQGGANASILDGTS